MCAVRIALEQLGHTIISTWLDEEGGQSYELNPTRGPGYALRDMAEVNLEADLLIIDTLEESKTGGREVELGMALARMKRTWRVGPARNIFHTITQRHYTSWEEVYADLRRDGTGRSGEGVCGDAMGGDQGRWEEEEQGGEA